MAASKRPQTIYIGTPPDENAPGVVFTRLRNLAKSGSQSKSCWSEWSVDEIGDTSDRERWAMTNPSLGYLIKESTVEGEHEQMAQDRFARERLGWWDTGGVIAVLPRDKWERCATDSPPDDGIKCFSVKFSTDGEVYAIAVALKSRNGGKAHFELVQYGTTEIGLAEIARWLAERKSDTAQYVIDGVGSAETLRDMMLRNGVSKALIKIPRASDMAAANAALLDLVKSGSVTYWHDETMDAAALGCSKRKIGTNGGWGFRSEDGADATVIEAAALALWGASITRRDPSRKARVAW